MSIKRREKKLFIPGSKKDNIDSSNVSNLTQINVSSVVFRQPQTISQQPQTISQLPQTISQQPQNQKLFLSNHQKLFLNNPNILPFHNQVLKGCCMNFLFKNKFF
jgi:hypothetical protein